MANRSETTDVIPSPEVHAEKERPLRTVVMLHAEPVWTAVILSTVTLQFLIVLYNVSFRGRLLEITKEPKNFSVQSYLMIMDALYCADFMLAWSYRSWKSISTISNIQPRKLVWLIVDLASLIPIDILLWFGTNLATTSPRVFYLWSLNRLLRIYRVNEFFSIARNSFTYVSVQIHLLEVFIFLLVFTMTATVIMFELQVDIEKEHYDFMAKVVGRLKPNNYKCEDWFWVSFYITFGYVSSHGTNELSLETNRFAFSLIGLVGAVIIRSLLLAYMVDIIQRRDYTKSLFNTKRAILGELLTSAVTKPTRAHIFKYYASFWETRAGQDFKINDFVMYPVIFKAECCLELSWDTFKHSKLFRHMPVPFLRNVGLLCERKFVLPGEFIIKKFDLKSGMIYIVSGSVHILSEEDNETPILSFSGGTILGETALFASYRSGVSVLACTPCELNVLRRNEFARNIVPTYPEEYEKMITAIDKRVKRAKFMTEIGVHLQKNRDIVGNSRNTDVAWLKATLSALQGAHRVDGRPEEIRERANLMEEVYAKTDIRYTFMFLDTIVISDDIALSSDAVFVQASKCPWILRPDSPILQLWDIVVLVCTLILSHIILVTITFHYSVTDTTLGWTNFLGAVLSLDFWVTLSTAIQQNDRMVVMKVSEILKIRLHDWRFWFDFLSAIPWTIVISDLASKYSFLHVLKLNRLLKLYKLEIIFTRIENSHKISLLILRTVKYSMYVVLLAFFLTCITLMATCPLVNDVISCHPTSWISSALSTYERLDHMKLSYSLLVVLQIILGIGTPMARPGAPIECAYWVVVMMAGALLFIFCMASVTSLRVLGQFVFAHHIHLSHAIHYQLNKTPVPEVLKKRVDSYLDTELCYDKGYRVATNEDVLNTLPPEVSVNWKYERFGRFISNIPLFMETDQEFVRELCCSITVGILPPKELLSYGGRHCTEMYIIEKGYCEMIHMEPSIPHRNVGPGTAIYPMEMCLQLPVVHTVVTSTYVSFLTINRTDFFRVYSNYPDEKFEFDQLLAEFNRIDRVVELRQGAKKRPEFIDALHSVRPPVPSFTFFVYTLNKEDPDYYLINEPFEKLKNFKFIKWLLLRLTIRPDGMFIKCYEVQRCLCAILSVIFHTMRVVIEASESGMFAEKIITFLNITAAFDIYVRMHVGYFSKRGLLVTHPLATATNYMKTSMFVDILGVLPFEQLIVRKSITTMDLFYFHLTRILQLHRVVGATKYLQESDSWTSIIKYGKFLPILLLIAHIFACIMLYTSCTFDTNYEATIQFGPGLRCPEWHSFFDISDNYQLTRWKVYQRALYIAISVLTRIGVAELDIKTPIMMDVLFLMSAVTFLTLLLLMGQIIADSAIRDGELTAYQDRMTTMVKFLNNKKISPELYKEAVYYFELTWKHTRGQNVNYLFTAFHSALREDLLCALFSKSLSKCPGLVDASETFYRYLLMHMRGMWFYPNGSVVTRYNDVLPFVVIIHTGSAEVVAPDGSLITTLGPGSIYGNLIGSTTVRMPVSIVITSHTESMVFLASVFFRALNLHPKAKRIFLNAMKLNTDYIRGIVDEDQVDVSDEISSPEKLAPKSTTIFFRVIHLLSMRVVDPNWLPIVIWDRSSLFFSCYVSPFVIIYQIAYMEFHIYWICFQYFTDVLFLSTIYLKVHSAFEDTHGNIVREKKRIWIKFIKSPLGFYAHLASVLPIELIAFMFEGRTMQKTYAWLRINRILRVAIIVDFFKVQCKRLNINIFRMRLAYLVMTLLFIIHVGSCLLLAIKENDDVYDMDITRRRTLYFSNLFQVASLYEGVITRRLPVDSSWQLGLFILVMEISMFVLFALIVGDMCAMVSVRHCVMSMYERVIRHFKIYMETCDLTYVLRKNLWTYGCSLWEFHRGRQIPHLVLEAPSYLRRQIKNALFIHHFENHKIFSGCHEDLLRQIVDHLKLINFFADDLIVNIGDINGNMYFINMGQVMAIHHDPEDITKETQKEIYEEGTSFGILSGLFPRFPLRATYRAFGKCKILILNRTKWFYLLDHFPASRDHIFSIANILKMRKGPIKLTNVR